MNELLKAIGEAIGNSQDGLPMLFLLSFVALVTVALTLLALTHTILYYLNVFWHGWPPDSCVDDDDDDDDTTTKSKGDN